MRSAEIIKNFEDDCGVGEEWLIRYLGDFIDANGLGEKLQVFLDILAEEDAEKISQVLALMGQKTVSAEK